MLTTAANTSGTSAATASSARSDTPVSGRSPPSMRLHNPSPSGIPSATASAHAPSCDTIRVITVCLGVAPRARSVAWLRAPSRSRETRRR